MAKKRKPPTTIAAKRRKRAKRVVTTQTTRTVREVRQNPGAMADFTHVILPGFGAYAATRAVQRVAFQIAGKRFPQAAKHIAAGAGVLAAVGAWLFAHKIKRLERFHNGIVLGSSIGALHGIAATYLGPKYSWLITDLRPEDVKALPAKNGTATANTGAPSPSAAAGDEYSYLESTLAEMEGSGSRVARSIPAPPPTARPVAQAMAAAAAAPSSGVALDPDLFEELGGEDVDDLYTGAFEN
jgi:hypothetical protein